MSQSLESKSVTSTSCCPNFSLRTLLKFLFNWAHLYQMLIFPNLSATSETNNHSAFLSSFSTPPWQHSLSLDVVILARVVTWWKLGQLVFISWELGVGTWRFCQILSGISTRKWQCCDLSNQLLIFGKTEQWKHTFRKRKAWTQGVKSRNKRPQGHRRSRSCFWLFSRPGSGASEFCLRDDETPAEVSVSVLPYKEALTRSFAGLSSSFQISFIPFSLTFSNQISMSAPSFSSLH